MMNFLLLLGVCTLTHEIMRVVVWLDGGRG